MTPSVTEPRKDSLIKYAETIGIEVIEINENTFNDIFKEFTWLAQLLYGQQLALARDDCNFSFKVFHDF
jgi:hypothetical protein